MFRNIYKQNIVDIDKGVSLHLKAKSKEAAIEVLKEAIENLEKGDE